MSETLNFARWLVRERGFSVIPLDHPDAAPALLTLAMSVADERVDLSEAYLLESGRLVFEAKYFSPLAKASRLRELARCAVQVGRKDWGKQLLDRSSECRGERAPGSTITANRPAAVRR